MIKTVLPRILLSGLVSGTLDCIAAVVFLGNGDFPGVWKYVASGYFGEAAFSGGNDMVAYGLLFHFSIAMVWAIVYGLFVKRIPFFTNHPVTGGLLYGIVVWLVMNLVVLPFTGIPEMKFTAIGVAKNIAILMLCVGLPISLIGNYNKERKWSGKK